MHRIKNRIGILYILAILLTLSGCQGSLNTKQNLDKTDASLAPAQSPDAAQKGEPATTKRHQYGENFFFLVASQQTYNPFKIDVDFAAAWASGTTDGIVHTNVWKDKFLTDIAHFGVLRFMNWVAINGNNVKDWADVRLPQDPDNNNIQGFNQNSPGGMLYRPLAYQWQIDLCNRTNSDLWLTLPAHTETSTDDYWGKLAALVKRDLNPKRKVYVEYGNEIWNSSFQQYHHAVQRATELGYTDSEYENMARYVVKSSTSLWKAFIDEFGEEGRERLVLVMPGQFVNTYLTALHYTNLKSKAVNPFGLRPDVYAIAPYFGHEIEDTQDLDVTFKELHKIIGSMKEKLQEQKALSMKEGVRLVTYEGGQHFSSNADIINKDPRMYEIYTEYLKMVTTYVDVYLNYLYVAPYSTGAAWGAKESIDQPTETSHKYRAILDWVTK